MTATAWSRTITVALGIVLGNLMVADFPMFQDYTPVRVSPVAFHAAVAVMGLVLGSLTRGRGLLQGVIVTLAVAFVLAWTVGLVAGARVGSGHLIDFILWSLFSRSAFVALVDGPLMFLTALAAAAWLPSLLP